MYLVKKKKYIPTILNKLLPMLIIYYIIITEKLE